MQQSDASPRFTMKTLIAARGLASAIADLADALSTDSDERASAHPVATALVAAMRDDDPVERLHTLLRAVSTRSKDLSGEMKESLGVGGDATLIDLARKLVRRDIAPLLDTHPEFGVQIHGAGAGIVALAIAADIAHSGANTERRLAAFDVISASEDASKIWCGVADMLGVAMMARTLSPSRPGGAVAAPTRESAAMLVLRRTRGGFPGHVVRIDVGHEAAADAQA